MKVEAKFLLFLAAFGAMMAVIFWFLSHQYAGSIMLIATACLALLPGSYYMWWSKRMTPRAEDNPKALPSDGSGTVGVFPSSSIWPFVLGMGAFMIALSLVFGFWTAGVGFFLGIGAVFGVISESRHGGESR